jgi:hypothetical protein
MKKLICIFVGVFLLWLFHLVAAAPEMKCLYVEQGTAICPYESIWLAVCMEESRLDSTVCNPKDPNGGSYGIAEIGKKRLGEYNKLTKHFYTIKDLYTVKVSKEIFMYYACRIGWRDSDKIIRRWNGSGPKTYAYLKRVRKWQKRIS